MVTTSTASTTLAGGATQTEVREYFPANATVPGAFSYWLSRRVVNGYPTGTTRITVTLEVPARENIGAPLDLERGLQRALNGLGQAVMAEALRRYDAEGEPIRLGPFAMTSKGCSPESYKLEHRALICENATVGLCAMLAVGCTIQQARRLGLIAPYALALAGLGGRVDGFADVLQVGGVDAEFLFFDLLHGVEDIDLAVHIADIDEPF